MTHKAEKMDIFTEKRLTRFVEKFRNQSGQLPTLKDFSTEGFSQSHVEMALKGKILEPFYVTLSNGTIVKTFKLRVKD